MLYPPRRGTKLNPTRRGSDANRIGRLAPVCRLDMVGRLTTNYAVMQLPAINSRCDDCSRISIRRTAQCRISLGAAVHQIVATSPVEPYMAPSSTAAEVT